MGLDTSMNPIPVIDVVPTSPSVGSRTNADGSPRAPKEFEDTSFEQEQALAAKTDTSKMTKEQNKVATFCA